MNYKHILNTKQENVRNCFNSGLFYRKHTSLLFFNIVLPICLNTARTTYQGKHFPSYSHTSEVEGPSLLA